MLESLASIMEAKRHPQELPEVERSDDCSFLYVSRPNRYLIITFLEVQFGEDSAACRRAVISVMLGTIYVSGLVARFRRL
jgi:hypothetical protein